MFRISVAAGAAAIGAALVLAQPVRATPEEDQFLYLVASALSGPLMPGDEDGIVGEGHTTCYLLDRGYDSAYVLNGLRSSPWLRERVADRIGFALAATRAFCPQFSYMFQGL
jgi:hypothetical protein